MHLLLLKFLSLDRSAVDNWSHTVSDAFKSCDVPTEGKMSSQDQPKPFIITDSVYNEYLILQQKEKYLCLRDVLKVI